MSIYPKKRNSKFYRKLWEQYHSIPIPKDEFGRSYDIHHIDGNRNNNSEENLLACPIQEHYDIHFSQEDWNACRLIALRMKKSPELISELASKAALKRVKDKTHNFLGGEIQRKSQKKKVNDGTHNLLGGEIQRKLVVDGIHHFLGGEIQRKNATRRVNNGTHNFLGGEIQRKTELKLVEEGKHRFQKTVTCRDKQGNVVQVPKEVYHKQKEITTDMSQWDFVTVHSYPGKERKLLISSL